MHVWKEEKAPEKPSPQTMERAWEIHKDADANLHGRVNVFVSTQAFLFAGLVALLTLDSTEPSRHWLIPVIFLVGVASTFVFAYSQARILSGIEFLKNEYLLKHDDIYKEYYWAKEQAVGRRRSLPVIYRVARGTPWAFLSVWLIIFMFTNLDWIMDHLGFALTSAP